MLGRHANDPLTLESPPIESKPSLKSTSTGAMGVKRSNDLYNFVGAVKAAPRPTVVSYALVSIQKADRYHGISKVKLSNFFMHKSKK